MLQHGEEEPQSTNANCFSSLQLDGIMKPMNRLCEIGGIRRHPDKFGCYPKIPLKLHCRLVENSETNKR
jgi:hypothetical protein